MPASTPSCDNLMFLRIDSAGNIKDDDDVMDCCRYEGYLIGRGDRLEDIVECDDVLSCATARSPLMRISAGRCERGGRSELPKVVGTDGDQYIGLPIRGSPMPKEEERRLPRRSDVDDVITMFLEGRRETLEGREGSWRGAECGETQLTPGIVARAVHEICIIVMTMGRVRSEEDESVICSSCNLDDF